MPSYPVALLALAVAATFADPPAADEAAVAAAVERLGDPNDDVRASAAAELRDIVKAYPSGTSNLRDADGGRQAWLDRVAQTKPGMTTAEVERLLPPLEPGNGRSENCSGDSCNVMYRLDRHWVVSMALRNPGTLIDAPTLTAREQEVYVPPPESFTGRWRAWHVNGQPAYEIEFKDGKYDGRFVCFHDNGVPSYEQHYVGHVAHGADTGWFKDGSLSYEAAYRDGKQDGSWVHYHEDGSRRSLREYRDGELHGRTATWDETGRLRHEAHYRSGLKEGVETSWNEHGMLNYRHRYEAGTLVK